MQAQIIEFPYKELAVKHRKIDIGCRLLELRLLPQTMGVAVERLDLIAEYEAMPTVEVL